MPCSPVENFLVGRITAVADATARGLITGIDRYEGKVVYQADLDSFLWYNGSAWMYLLGKGTYTPALTNWAIGTGGAATLAGRWVYSFGNLKIEGNAGLGSSGASVSGAMTISLPTGFTADSVFSEQAAGWCSMTDTGTASYRGPVHPVSTTTVRLQAFNVSATYGGPTNTSSTVPHTWASTDLAHWEASLVGAMTAP